MTDPGGRVAAARMALDAAYSDVMERQAQDARRLSDLQTDLSEALNAARG